MKLQELTYTQLKKLRKKQWLLQNKKCAVLKKPIEYKDATMDHKHIRKGETLGENGKGLLRGVLDFRANSFEGKVSYWYERLGLHKLIGLPELLRNLASFLESPPMKPMYIHPSERKKSEKLGKRDYNKLRKRYFELFPKRKAFPKYPKSKRVTKEIEKIIKDIKNKEK